MTRQQLSALIDTLTPALKVRREHVLRTRHGHERLVAPGAGTKAKLTPADGILVTALHLRKLATTDPSTSSPAVTHDHQPRETGCPSASGRAQPQHHCLHRPLTPTLRHHDVPGCQTCPKQDQERGLKTCTPLTSDEWGLADHHGARHRADPRDPADEP